MGQKQQFFVRTIAWLHPEPVLRKQSRGLSERGASMEIDQFTGEAVNCHRPAIVVIFSWGPQVPDRRPHLAMS